MLNKKHTTAREIPKIISATLDSSPKLVLTCIILLAIIINLAVLYVRPPVLANGQYQIGQTYRWWPLTLNLINGRGYTLCTAYFPFCGPGDQPTASMEPVPVFFFGLVAILTNQSLPAACFAEIGINLTLLLAIYSLTKRIANPRAALLAAFIWATYLPALKLIPQVSGDLLGSGLLTLAMFFFFRARTSRRWYDWAAAGILLGLAIQSRSALLVVLPAFLAGLLLEAWLNSPGNRTKILGNLLPGAAITALVFATMFPWFVRNQKEFGNPILGTTLTGYVLYRQNYMLGDAGYLRIVGADEALSMMTTFLARHPELGPATTELQMSKTFTAEAVKIISAHPMQYVGLSLYRFLPLWFNWGVDEAYGNQPPLLAYLLMIEQALLLAAALLGAWLTGKRSWPLWSSIGIVTLAYMAVNAQLRYLIPVLPFVVSLAAIGITTLLFKNDQKQTGQGY